MTVRRSSDTRSLLAGDLRAQNVSNYLIGKIERFATLKSVEMAGISRTPAHLITLCLSWEHYRCTGRITGRSGSLAGFQNGGHDLDDHKSMQLDTTTTTISSRPEVPELDYVQPRPPTSRIPWTERNRTEPVRLPNFGGETAMSNMSGVNTHPSDTIQHMPFFSSYLSNFRAVPFYVGHLGHRQRRYRKQGIETLSGQSLRPGCLKRPRTVLDVDHGVAA